MHFHNLTYSISTTFYKVYECIKISQTERIIYIYIYIQLAFVWLRKTELYRWNNKIPIIYSKIR